MAASANEYLLPWERAVEEQYRVDFLFRTYMQDIIDCYPVGRDYRGWPRVYRVMFAVRDEGGCTSVFGRAYRKYLHLMPGGGGVDLPVWKFDVNGCVPERYGFDPPVIAYVPGKVTEVAPHTYRVDSWGQKT